jgi:hypothetical protein
MAPKAKPARFVFCRRDVVHHHHPSGHDVGDGSAELVTDLPPSTSAFVLAGGLDVSWGIVVRPS